MGRLLVSPLIVIGAIIFTSSCMPLICPSPILSRPRQKARSRKKKEVNKKTAREPCNQRAPKKRPQHRTLIF